MSCNFEQNKSLDIKKELFEREADIYTNFEDTINELSSNKAKIKNNFEYITYLFCKECYYRDIDATHWNHEKENCISFDGSNDENILYEDFYLGSEIILKASETTKSILKELCGLDKTVFNYFWNVVRQTLSTNYQTKQYDTTYKVINEITKEDLIDSIGENRVLEISGLGEHYIYIPKKINIQDILAKLEEEEKEKILYTVFSKEKIQFNTELKTYIMNNDKKIISHAHLGKTIFVELDLTKPKKQLIGYLEYLIEEYNKEEKPIQSIIELLGNEESYNEDISNILKINKKIPLGVKLADLLYTYDCQHNSDSISINNILDALNDYHYDFCNLQNDTNRRSSVHNGSKIIKEYIDKKKYLQYYGQPIANISESIASQIGRAEEEYFFNPFNY